MTRDGVAGFQRAIARRFGLTVLPAGAVVLAWALSRHAERASTVGVLVLLALCVVVAAGLIDGRLLALRHGIALALGFVTVLVATAVVFSGDTESVFSLFFFWCVPVGFGLLPLRPALALLGLMAAAFGAALLSLGGEPDRLLIWFAVVVSTGVVGGLLRSLSGSARDAEEHFSRAFEGSPLGMVAADLNLRVTRVNPALCAFLGRSESELVDGFVADYSHPADMAENVLLHRAMVESGGTAYDMEKRYVRGDGSIVWGHLRVSLVRDDRGRPRSLHAQIEDISTRRLAEEALDMRVRHGEAAAELGRIALSAPGVEQLAERAAGVIVERLEVDSCAVMAVDGDELQMLGGCGSNTGRRLGERWLMRPRSLGRLALDHDGPIAVDIRGGEIEASAEMLASETQTALSVSVDGCDGPLGVLTVFSVALREFSAEESDFLHVVANVMGSAIERAAREADAIHRALHDPLTGLPNRDLFADRLEKTLARVRRGGSRPAVLIADLDQFKLINDSLGHPAGDELLRLLAPRLAGALRATDTVARFGGDEFVVLCDGVEDEAHAMALASRLAAVLEAPVDVAGTQVVVSASVGVSVAEPGSDVESLVRDADAALYRAKARGRGRCALFDAALRAEVTERLDLETTLRAALASGALALHYQPVVDLATGVPRAFEALMRWTHPERGSVAPDEFIPIAEESGLIVPMGRWALHEACRFATSPAGAGLPISVNLAARQLAYPGLVADVESALDAAGLEPGHLWLELTESALLDDDDAPLATLNELKALGVRLVIDDFGTGYSSLAYLQRFPLDALKVDRAFVSQMTEDGRAAALVQAVVTMTRALGLQVIPEGIETEAQRDALLELGCTYGQGYLFGRPAPAGELEPEPAAV